MGTTLPTGYIEGYLSGGPQDTECVSEQIAGAALEIMDDMGHFPPSENPSVFEEYLMPAVDEILED